VVLSVAFVLPIAQLAHWAVIEIVFQSPGALVLYRRLAGNSLMLSGLAAGAATVLAVMLANGIHLNGGRLARLTACLATMGYAVPGAVIAVGILVPLSAFDHAVNNLVEGWWGVTPGLMLTGSIVGLVYAYVVRYMAVAYNGVESSLDKVPPNITHAARTLGATSRSISWHIHLPLIAPGMLAGATLVFVDVMKELPITLMLRPFGYDTLAVWVWQMASESLWAGAALPALTIVAVGILPVILLIHVATPKRI
jgi:iron(III) transport system permease protein